MLSLVYVSSAVVPLTKDQLTDLLSTSRTNNERAGISGMLLYKDGSFMQLIEGEEEAVDALQKRIAKDDRHCGMVQLLRETIDARQFPDWSMGFRDLKSADVRELPGYSEILNYDLTGKEFQDRPSLAQKLLLSFKKAR